MSMNPEIKALWVKALRSGEYRQTHGLLYHNGGYCCIGVLGKALGVQLENKLPRDLRTSVLDIQAMEKAQLSSDEADAFALMNDEGYSFVAIADKIEEKL